MVADCDVEENTPLHFAVEKGLSEVCQLLLEAGAKPNALRYNGGSPLHLAAKSGDESICRILVEVSHAQSPTLIAWTMDRKMVDFPSPHV
jgi:ankyrin repeat protein